MLAIGFLRCELLGDFLVDLWTGLGPKERASSTSVLTPMMSPHRSEFGTAQLWQGPEHHGATLHSPIGESAKKKKKKV